MDKTYRIKDIARLSGVSTGTVDRILHNRGKVSVEAKTKVENILKEINYQPNVIARSLALKKIYKFVVITPYFREGEYWAKLSEGVDKAQQELYSYNVSIERLYFDQYDKNSFNKLIDEIEKFECNGVILSTLFEESAISMALKLDKLKTPYVLIDSFLDNTNCIAYYGTHSYDSGYIAGRVLLEQISKTDDIAIFRFLRKGDERSTQVAKREEGFRNYLKEHGYEGSIHVVKIHAEKEKINKEILQSFFTSNRQVKAGIIFNSRANLVCECLCEIGITDDFKLIGYDVLDSNIHYLKRGIITHLIAQRPEVQGLNSVKALFRHLILHKEENLINYMPIDILLKENIAYYNNYI